MSAQHLLVQLLHDGIDPGETSPCFIPRLVKLIIVIPVDPLAYGIPLHLIEVDRRRSYEVEELPPAALGVLRHRYERERM